MPIQILMPALSPTMTEGGLARWLKKEGDKVKSGDVLAEIETDKATMEFEAVDEGTLGRILVPGGSQGVTVNTPIAVLLSEGEDASALGAAPAAAPAPAKPATAEAPKPAPAQAAAAPAPAPKPASPTPTAVPAKSGASRIFATPLARRLAKEAGIDLTLLAGSGPHGRITKEDVLHGKPAAGGRAPSRPLPVRTPGVGPAYVEQPLSSMRKVIARRMVELKTTVPHFYLTVDCKIDKLLSLRGEYNEHMGIKASVNDFIIKAVALALQKVPAANASYANDVMRIYKDVDVAVAVAIPGGLVTPVIRNADQKDVATIASEMKSLAGRARDGKLKPEEYSDGTFTISNLGMFGIREFSAIINPPQGAILAIGAGEQRPVVEDGKLAVATVMTCTVAVDHRVMDGAIGAEFLGAYRGLIEKPLALVL